MRRRKVILKSLFLFLHESNNHGISIVEYGIFDNVPNAQFL